MNDIEKVLLGKTITAVEISDDRDVLTFRTTTGPVKLQTGAD